MKPDGTMDAGEAAKVMAWLVSMKGKAWVDAMEDRYSATFQGVTYPEALQALELIDLECQYRPEPAEVYGFISRVVSPQPSPEEAYQEVKAKIDKYGLNGLQEDPSREIYKPGPPAFSHALVAAAVERLGGWEAICSGSAQYQSGGLRGSYIEAYNGAAGLWAKNVVRAVKMGLRPPQFFPRYIPFEPASLDFIALRHLNSSTLPQNAIEPKQGPLLHISSPAVEKILGDTKALVSSWQTTPPAKRRLLPNYQPVNESEAAAELDRIKVINREAPPATQGALPL